MTDVLILTGSPGSGKSTVARLLAPQIPRCVLLPTDDFWRAIVSGGIAPYLPEAEEQNHTVVDVIAVAAFGYARGGFTTIVDGIVGPWMLHHYQSRLAEHPGIGLHYVVLRPSRDVALARAQQRTSPDALVDAGPVVDLWDQFADIGALEDHVIDTTDLDAERTVAAVRDAFVAGRARLR